MKNLVSVRQKTHNTLNINKVVLITCLNLFSFSLCNSIKMFNFKVLTD